MDTTATNQKNEICDTVVSCNNRASSALDGRATVTRTTISAGMARVMVTLTHRGGNACICIGNDMNLPARPLLVSGVNMFRFETEAYKNGYTAVAGIDEVGRGPIAGPVLAAAVILPVVDDLPAVTDSKKIAPSRRVELAAEIKSLPGVQIGLGIVESPEIDRINILQATYQAMRKALNELSTPADYALVDGKPVPELPVPSTAIVSGDSRSLSIAAASIIAKVTRDRMMMDYDKVYAGYQFAEHKGYGTRRHLAALRKLGPCPIHRRSFGPVSRIINGGYYQPEFNLSTDF